MKNNRIYLSLPHVILNEVRSWNGVETSIYRGISSIEFHFAKVFFIYCSTSYYSPITGSTSAKFLFSLMLSLNNFFFSPVLRINPYFTSQSRPAHRRHSEGGSEGRPIIQHSKFFSVFLFCRLWKFYH